jgi:hypothetical protein
MEESNFKHRLVFLLKDKLSDGDSGYYSKDSVKPTSPAFLFFETCMRSELSDKFFIWTKDVFFVFKDSYPLISRNAVLCLHFYLRYYLNKISIERLVEIRMMLTAGLDSSNARMRMVCAEAFSSIPDRETLRILGFYFNKEKNFNVREFLRKTLQKVIVNVNSREKRFLESQAETQKVTPVSV